MTAVDERVTPTGSARTGTFPVAQLLPDIVVQRRRVGRVRRLVLMAVGVVAILVCGVWALGASEITNSEQQLAEVQDTGVRLKAEQAKYSEVPLVAAQVTNAQADLERALGGQVNWSGLLTQLALTAPEGAQVVRVTAALPPAPASPAEAKAAETAEQAGATSVAGQLIIGIRTTTFPSVAAWLDSLAELPTLADPTLTRSAVESAETKTVTGEANVAVTGKALTNRYVAQEDK